MADRQVSIYVPPQAGATVPDEHWATTVLGELRAAIHGAEFAWCWSTKYTLPWAEDATQDQVPKSFQCQDNGETFGCYAKLRFRKDDTQPFETQVKSLADAKGWHAVFSDYDLAADLGSDRFLGPEQHTTPAHRKGRAELVVSFLSHGLLLALDTLVKDGAGWRFEHNQHTENPMGNMFQSVVHLVCNMTDAHTLLFVQSRDRVVPVPVTF